MYRLAGGACPAAFKDALVPRLNSFAPHLLRFYWKFGGELATAF